jgi:hypothetical protein
MSDRYTIVTTAFVAGIMLGALTVQIKDQISLQLGTLGFNAGALKKYLITDPRRSAPLHRSANTA